MSAGGKGSGKGPGKGSGKGSGRGSGKGPGKGGGGGSVRVKTAKGRPTASTRWLARQLNDPYVAEAQRLGYRSRAAFKLIEMDDKLGLLKPGARVVDLGAAPGGWCQVAVERCGTKGRVVGLDILEMEPIPGAVLLRHDFLAEDAERLLIEALGGQADLVLSDMAAPTTGHAATDHLRVVALAEAALDFAERVLAPGGGFVAKVFQGGSERSLLERLRRGFAKVRHIKPPASRQGSSELYVVATGFRRAEKSEQGPDTGQD
jgi:23S rRNA (uridine2552-2'-O)-methyltransferase